MKTKILIILIVLISLGAGGFFVYKNMTGLKVEEGIVPAPATQVRVYKGTWTPALLSKNSTKLASDMRKLKALGMNTVFFQGAPPQPEHCLEGVPPDSKLVKIMKEIIPVEKELMISNIQIAHKNGLKVALTMSKCMPASKKIALEAWNARVIELAKLAEEHEVELFAPMNEPEVLFGPSASATWGQEILPKIREVYHGKVIWKGDAVGGIQPAPGQPGPNFSGYDYVGFTIGVGSGRTLETLPQRVDYALDTILGYAERDNCEGVMISEFFGQLPSTWKEREWNEEKEARANEIILEEGSKRDKVVGFFALDFLDLSFFGKDIPGLPGPEESAKTQEVIKRWFTEIL
ncbi:MAG: hypothetical protein ABH816_01625 [Candidatus Levyibacteriota bacterium]